MKPSQTERRRFLKAGVLALAGAGIGSQWLAAEASGGRYEETLYNGIRLPSPWPPNLSKLPNEPIRPYYLASPPSVIPIDVGRQLFVDDFLIHETTLRRTFHQATYHPANPILKPDQPWEQTGRQSGSAPAAIPFCDGVWFDPADRLYKMWYMGGLYESTCLATSLDGIRWNKPEFDVKRGTSVVQALDRDGATVWLDLEEKDPARRYKMLRNYLIDWKGPIWRGGLTAHFSKDGVHWSDAVLDIEKYGDGTSIFWNPFRKKWVLSIRDSDWYWNKKKPNNRVRRYHEGGNFLDAVKWRTPEGADTSVLWTGADGKDQLIPGPESEYNVLPGLYTLHAVAYESLILGGFSILPGYKDGTKLNYGALGFSRDGFTWDRPNREPFLPVGKFGEWNTGYIHFAGGICLVVKDQLYFYLCARQPVPGKTGVEGTRIYNTGMATLRRDGFASMDAGSDGGTLTTRSLRFKGKHLFVNIEAPEGQLQVEVLDETGKNVPGYSVEDCVTVRGNKTLQPVTWKGMGGLSSLSGRSVRFRFHLKQGKLYAFWVSPDESGASHGYVAAGGPGYIGPTDTAGLGG